MDILPQGAGKEEDCPPGASEGKDASDPPRGDGNGRREESLDPGAPECKTSAKVGQIWTGN